MTTASWIVLVLFTLVVLAVLLWSRRPEVRRRYDRWGVGHGHYSSRAAGWTGGDVEPRD